MRSGVVLLEFLGIGGSEMILIGIAILLLFGGKKLPELMRGLGKGIREFKDASEGVKQEIHRNINHVASDIEDTETPAQNERKQFHPETETPPAEANHQSTIKTSDSLIQIEKSKETSL